MNQGDDCPKCQSATSFLFSGFDSNGKVYEIGCPVCGWTTEDDDD